MVTKFGIWEIDKAFGIIGRVNPSYDYRIAKKTLWDTQDFKGHILWDWLIQLTEKTWVNKEIFNDLVIAFIFSMDYFIENKPKDAEDGSIAQSIYIGQQLVELREKSDNVASDLDLASEETLSKITEAFDNDSKIKPLRIR